MARDLGRGSLSASQQQRLALSPNLALRGKDCPGSPVGAEVEDFEIAHSAQHGLAHAAACPAQAVQQQRVLFIGGEPGDLVAQAVERDIDRPRQMPLLKLPFAAHINDSRALFQPGARRVWPHEGEALEEEEGRYCASDDGPGKPIHTGRNAALN